MYTVQSCQSLPACSILYVEWTNLSAGLRRLINKTLLVTVQVIGQGLNPRLTIQVIHLNMSLLHPHAVIMRY